MPIRNREDAVEVADRISRIFDAAPEQRAAPVRGLFVEVLDFNPASGQVSLADAAGNVHLPAAADRIAELDGVHVLFIPLPAANTDRVRKAEVDAAAKLLANQLGDDLLLVCANPSASQLHVILPGFAGARPTLRRLVLHRDRLQRTAVQQVANIYWNWQSHGSIRAALAAAFDVEPVTSQFFGAYRNSFNRAKAEIGGFGDSDAEAEAKHVFTQTLFNRLMFVYFLSRKGWLTFAGDADYLNALWRDYQARPKDGDCYTTRLQPLFFSGLNNPESRNLTEGLETLIGQVPFLNGGLFEKTDLDRRENITVPDAVIEGILADLFDRFNFTVMESTPFDIEVAVDPEMLGKVFEELVTERHASGAYYTPRPVVSFMCREALKGYLEGQDTGASAPALAAFVDRHDTAGLGVAEARSISRALEEVTVVDPACGSGAYLLGMMQELIELQNTLFNVGVDDKSLYDLKLEIIQRNLYGVDLDGFAVNIAMLRLWLSLAIDYEGDAPQPLPNLDFKVLEGDSLLGPDPSAGVEVQGTLGQDIEQFRRLGELKGEYMRATAGNDKDRLRGEIVAATAAIREALGAGGAVEGVIDWRVEFAEVFAENKGFDVAIANPPYIQLQGNGGRLANRYRDAGYQTFARTGDIYQLFYERGMQLLRPGQSLLSYITSNSWLKAEYGKATRRWFAENHTPLHLLELGKDVFEAAIVDSCIHIARQGKSDETGRAVDLDRLADKSFPPAEHLWGELRIEGDKPWSALSVVERSVMDKMQSVGTPVKDWGVRINFGIKTGYNRAFLIDGDTRDRLIAASSKSRDIIKPVLRGRDVRRYRANPATVYLIDTNNGYGEVPPVNVVNYPAIKGHLDQFFTQLEKRQDKGVTPYNLRSCAYYEEFAKEKLFWMEMSNEARFAFSETEIYCNNKAYFITGDSLKFLCAVLNSALITWFVRHTASTTGMGVTEWFKITVERIPIPKIGEGEQQPLVALVEEILAAKDANSAADTTDLEREIDRLVYELYGLEEEEVTAIERSLGLIHQTDEEEDAALARLMEDQAPYGPDDFVSEEEVRGRLRAVNGS